MLSTILSIPVGVCSVFPEATSNVSFVRVLGILRFVVRILQIVIPILLILFGSIDIAKAVVAGKDDEIEKAKKPFVKRIVAAVIVFLIPFLVGLLLNLFSATEWKECWNAAGKAEWKKLFDGSPLDIK